MIKLDKSKLQILELLNKPMTVTEIAKETGLSKATVSHHLKYLEELKLVKIHSTKIERNFIKKYYISTLHTEDIIMPQEPNILEDFKPDREGFFRTVLRMLSIFNLDNGVFLKKIGFDVGYHSLAEKVDGKIDDGLAEIWEKLKLGKVVECGKDRFVIEECYNCYRLPEIGKPYCKIDEGIIEGILSKKLKKKFIVKEVRCWGTGDEVCDFEIKEIKF